MFYLSTIYHIQLYAKQKGLKKAYIDKVLAMEVIERGELNGQDLSSMPQIRTHGYSSVLSIANSTSY